MRQSSARWELLWVFLRLRSHFLNGEGAVEAKMADMDDVKQELDALWKELHTKQERVKPAVSFAFLMWLIGVTVSGAWWAATMTSQLQGLEGALTAATNSQYKTETAAQDLRLRDQRLDFLQQQMDAHKSTDVEEHRALKDRLKAAEEKIRAIELNK